MFTMRRIWPIFMLGLPVFLVGCASERAFVSVGYVLDPSQGLPPGMRSVAIEDAVVNDPEDSEWSRKAAESIQARILDAKNRFGADIVVADRRYLKDVMDEADLAAAGITSNTSGAGLGGKVMGVQGIIKSSIDVKAETHVGKATTIDGVDWWGYRNSGGGRVYTREVDTVSRNITVKTTFKLFDATTNRDWVTYSPDAYQQHDKTEAFPILGSSRTEAELQPRDQIIAEAMNKGVREFIAKILPCEISYQIPVDASGNKNCQLGVQMMRADAHRDAIGYFRSALAENGNDHQAAYAAGVACEAIDDFKQALQFYRKAYAIRGIPRYREAKDRLNNHLPYIRQSAVN